MNNETALLQLQFCYNVIKANLGGITHEESLYQPTPAGNCANWVLGHIVAIRCEFLPVFGSEPVWDEADCAPYNRHGPPLTQADEAKPLDEIWKALDATQERLRNAVSALTPEMLSQKSPNDPNKTVGAMLAVLGFHDAYHAGQTGMLRRILGKPPADL